MNRFFIALALIISPGISLGAVDLEGVLAQIEENNLSLKALKQNIEAQSEENLAEILLDDPQIEYSYLFGPEGLRRHDIGVSQSFDYATLSGIKKKTAISQNDLLQLEYRYALGQLKTQARNLICQIIYYNALIGDLEDRLEQYKRLEHAYKLGFESGEFSVPDYRKAQVAFAGVQAQLDLSLAQRSSLAFNLRLLNGGNEIIINDKEQITPLLPVSFELWLEDAAQRSSALRYVRNNVVLSENQLKLAKSQAIPAISIGYAAELVPGSNFHGISFGLSLPLWSSKRRISAAKTKLIASQNEANSSLLEFSLKAKALYDKATSLSQSGLRYLEFSPIDSVISDMDKALLSGQISLIDYLSELSLYYESRELILNSQLEYALSCNELFELEY